MHLARMRSHGPPSPIVRVIVRHARKETRRASAVQLCGDTVSEMSGGGDVESVSDVRVARSLFPATESGGVLQHGRGGSGEPNADRGLPPLRRRLERGSASTTSGVRRPARLRVPSVAGLIGAEPVRRRIDRVGVRRRRSGGCAVRTGRSRAQRRDRRARVQLEPLPVAAAREQGLRRSSGSVPERRAGTRRHRRARRRWNGAGRVQRRADRNGAPFRHPGDQRDRAAGRRDRLRRRLAARRCDAGCGGSRRHRRVGDFGPQVPA